MTIYQVDTVAALNAGTFAPGDIIQLKRGNVYPGPLTFAHSGSAGNPITITSYGDPSLPQPQITGSSTLYQDALTIGGSNLVLDHLLFTDTNRAGVYLGTTAPVGGHETYFPVSNVTIQYCEMTRVGEGVNCASNNVVITKNYIHDLTEVKNTVTPTNDDYGANGVVLGGNNIEVSWNIFKKNEAASDDYGVDGGAIELFVPTVGGTCSNISIHDNYFESCEGILEGGGPVNSDGTPGCTISNVSFNNNICVNSSYGQDYITIHNAGGSFGCFWSGVKIYNNTFVEENNSPGSGKFLVFDGSAPSQIAGFEIDQNIICLNDGKCVFSQYELTTHHDNCFYFGVPLAGGGTAGLHIFNTYQNTLAPGEVIANPLFTNQVARDFRLLPGSPATGMGGNASALTATANAALIALIQQGLVSMGTHPSFGTTGATAAYTPKTTDETDNSVQTGVVPHVNAQIQVAGSAASGSNPVPVSVTGTVTITPQRAESLWTDDTGVYFVRVDLGGAISWTDLSGNALAAPGTGARAAAGTTTLLSRSSFQATAAATGYSVGDYLDHFVTTDPASGAVLGNFWINLTTGAKLASAPASANITPVSALASGAATSARQDTGNTALAQLHTDLTGALSVIEQPFVPVPTVTVALTVGPVSTLAPVALPAATGASYRIRNAASSASAVAWKVSTNAAAVAVLPVAYSAAGTGGTVGDKMIDPGGVEIISLSAAQIAALAAGTLYLAAIAPAGGSATLYITPGTGA